MHQPDIIIEFPTATEPRFKMVDIGHRRCKYRRAVASGTISMSAEAFKRIKSGTVPKGDVLALAEAAGIAGAKKTPEMLPMCHTLPLDQVTIYFALDDEHNKISVYCQTLAFAKTGVGMEALVGVNSALLAVWDLIKGVDPDLMIGNVELLIKMGGRSGTWINPKGIPSWLAKQMPDPQILRGKRAAVLVVSDRAAKGEYKDKSGPILKGLLENIGAKIVANRVIPDEALGLEQNISNICCEQEPDLLITAGGTGPAPRDVTPEVLEKMSNRMLDGLGDMLRAESLTFTDTAWLSRMTAGMVGKTLVIALPGSPQAVQECWYIMEPFLGYALERIAKQGFEE